jgi:hypothetical protein
MRDWRNLDMSCETMTQAMALDIVQREASDMGMPMLETLMFMGENLEEYGSVERCAYRTAMRGFQRLLAPA